MSRCRNSYVEQALLPRHLEDLAGGDAGGGGYRSLLQDSLDALLKEAKDKFKGYDSCSTPEHVELSCRKVSARCSHFYTWRVSLRVQFLRVRCRRDQQSCLSWAWKRDAIHKTHAVSSSVFVSCLRFLFTPAENL